MMSMETFEMDWFKPMLDLWYKTDFILDSCFIWKMTTTWGTSWSVLVLVHYIHFGSRLKSLSSQHFQRNYFHRHWIKHRHLLPHDAVLQLRRASHLWAGPKDLLPVWLQEATRWSDQLSLESAAEGCGRSKRSREVRCWLTFFENNSWNVQMMKVVFAQRSNWNENRSSWDNWHIAFRHSFNVQRNLKGGL